MDPREATQAPQTVDVDFDDDLHGGNSKKKGLSGEGAGKPKYKRPDFMR